MAGVSEMPFRCIAREMGAAAAPTELVSAKSLSCRHPATFRYLRHDENLEQPYWVQLFGGDPDVCGEAALVAAELGAKIIDLNMGCPVKKVTANGSGSALMRDPERAGRIVEKMKMTSGLPVTAKIRAGWDADSVNYLEVGTVLQQAGAAAVAIHPRTRTQAYSGIAVWDRITNLAHHLTIPVIGNGDIQDATDARRMLNQTGCAGVMIGRAALGNPWIFSDLGARAATVMPGPFERFQLALRHFRDHLKFTAQEIRAVRTFRPHWRWYSNGLWGQSEFLRRVVLLDECSQVIKHAEDFFSSANDKKGHWGPSLGETKNALG